MKKASVQAGFEPLTFGSAIRYSTTSPIWHIVKGVGSTRSDDNGVVETQ